MTAMFKKPPKPKKPPKMPNIDEARTRMQEEDENRRRTGRSSAVLGGASDSAFQTSATVLGGTR